MLSLSTDVDEFLTHVIKFYRLFPVNDLHELICHVVFVCLLMFLSFIDHHAHDLVEELYHVQTLFCIHRHAFMLCDFSGTEKPVFVSKCFAIHIMTNLDLFGALYDVIFIQSF